MCSISVLDFKLIPANEVKFLAAYDVLDAMLMADPEQWADSLEVDTQQVARFMTQAAWRLKIAVI